ncbi:MAG: beta-N-acetylhexosaminidase [Chitinophagaceae bacterium]
MKKFVAIVFLVCTLAARSQSDIVPTPVKSTSGTGVFKLSSATVLLLQDQAEQATADFLNDYLQRFYGFRLKTASNAAKNYIRFGTKRFIQPGKEGRYEMLVKPDFINIEGDTYQGTFYGMQSLIQLLPIETNRVSIAIPQMTIEDYPRFSYRGLHLDVTRHFMPIEFVKKYIDYIAMHKMNYFHWHLTDDQGWRIEIKKYPRLTEMGGRRHGTIIGRYPGKGNDNIPYGGFYTQEEIKQVIDYAAKRYVTIVPEIEMPGHASAAIAAFPWLSCFPEQKTRIPDNMISEASQRATGKLVQETWGVFDDVFCAGKDSTFTFLENVLDEVMALFPGKHIHVGGDESPKTHWKKCPRCQQRIKDNNLKDEHELQSYFIQRMEKYVNSKGKVLIGWDEILEGGLAPNAIVMSWRGEEGGIEAAKQNHSVIMTPGNYVYFDHTQTKNEDSVTIGGYTPLEEVYGYEPVPKELPADKSKFVWGAQANLWTEYIKNTRKVEYMLFPRLAALSEVLWSPKEKRDFKNLERRLPLIFARYRLWGANYSTAYYDLKATISPSPDYNGLLWKLESKVFNQPDLRSFSNIWITSPNFYNQKTKVVVPDWTKDPDGAKGVMKDTMILFDDLVVKYTKPVVITRPGIYKGVIIVSGPDSKSRELGRIEQKFSFNKATGKKISLTTAPSASYPGNPGAFGLINGALSGKGISSAEWLGWSGPDMVATIDLVKPVSITSVKIHTMEQNGGWVYLPANVEVHTSTDGKKFTRAGTTTSFNKDESGFASGFMNVDFSKRTVRYIKIIAKSYGKIPDGKAGAGNPAWLFVDEIQVN